MYEKTTDNYDLPQWTAKDHPDFLTDMNQAMRTIDQGMEEAKVAADGAKDVVDKYQGLLDGLQQTLDSIDQSITQLESTTESHSRSLNADATAISNLRSDVDTLKAQVGTITAADVKELQDTLTGYTASRTVQMGINTVQQQLAPYNTTNKIGTKVNELITSTEALAESIDNMLTAMEPYNLTTNKIGTKVAALQTSLDALKAEVATLDTSGTELNTAFQTFKSAQETKNQEVATQLASTTNKADANATEINSIDARVDTLEQDMNDTTVNVGDNTSDITKLQTIIGADRWVSGDPSLLDDISTLYTSGPIKRIVVKDAGPQAFANTQGTFVVNTRSFTLAVVGRLLILQMGGVTGTKIPNTTGSKISITVPITLSELTGLTGGRYEFFSPQVMQFDLSSILFTALLDVQAKVVRVDCTVLTAGVIAETDAKPSIDFTQMFSMLGI